MLNLRLKQINMIDCFKNYKFFYLNKKPKLKAFLFREEGLNWSFLQHMCKSNFLNSKFRVLGFKLSFSLSTSRKYFSLKLRVLVLQPYLFSEQRNYLKKYIICWLL